MFLLYLTKTLAIFTDSAHRFCLNSVFDYLCCQGLDRRLMFRWNQVGPLLVVSHRWTDNDSSQRNLCNMNPDVWSGASTDRPVLWLEMVTQTKRTEVSHISRTRGPTRINGWLLNESRWLCAASVITSPYRYEVRNSGDQTSINTGSGHISENYDFSFTWSWLMSAHHMRSIVGHQLCEQHCWRLVS